ncbi:leucine-rich repeat-containing protein 34 [Stylonychia lemnae]|uniref:Leucine-rich repeat-containing protein 34 n=1 Tax=Stylonychia lemnae TaxID=5949 RepID=A0A078B0X1_STYLE|nr:leucine-rich repeat-containing protein 34 [Stylonychia lemnae]|eukprot:CDW87966.1 leucine-rich repeat-containing protein 34 [Stylonychia lemnae]
MKDQSDNGKSLSSPKQADTKKPSEQNSPDDKEKTLLMDQMTAIGGIKSSMATSQNKSQNNPNTTIEMNKRFLDETQDEDANNNVKGKHNSNNSNINRNSDLDNTRYQSRNNQNDDYIEDHSRNNILPQDEYDEDEDIDDSFDGDNQSMYSHVASQHPLSVDEERVNTTQKTDGSEDEYISKKLQMTKKELAPIIMYKFGFLLCITIPPLFLYQDCRTSPYFFSHVIFLILQICLFGVSTFYHRRKNGKNGQNNEVTSSLMRSQGRCCREILSHMKIIDTYTNLCFFSLVLNQADKIPGLIYGVSAAAIGVTILFKIILVMYFLIFVLVKLGKEEKPKNENENTTLMKKNVSQTILNQKTLTKLLLWLDQDTIAKLYDPDNDQSGESQLFIYHKQKYSYFKSLFEDAPLAAMQALYLSQESCSAGLNSIIIISLYFNSVCILYSVSNLCSSKNKEGGGSKIYKKELDRLRDYYDGNQARVIAEFYIEDQNDIQAVKMKALNDFLSYHEYDVQSFNFSTNQMSEETINYLQEIIVNSSESLEDLTLSRCKLKSLHLSYFYYPKCLLKLNLSENRIGDSGAKLIANYILEKNQESLLALNLEHNNISEQGALALLKAIQQSSVVHVNLRKNRGDPVTQQYSLGLAFDFFKVLQLNFIRYFVAKKLQGNGARLEEGYMVKLSINEGIDRVLLSLFRIDVVQTLRSLDLSMRFFRSMRANMQKEKAQNGIQNQNKNLLVKGLKFYDDEQKLILLAIHYNSNLLKNLPEKEKLSLSSIQNWYYLGNSVNSINLSSNWLSQRAQQLIFSSLQNMLNLKELVFNNNYIKNSPLFFKSITECKNLESVYLKSCSFYGVFEIEFKTCFFQLENLKDLRLSYSNITDQTILMLSECISQLISIQKINLKQCGLTHISLDSIFERLSTNQTILSMNLSQNDLQGILQLGKFIKMNKTIEKLKLAKTQLSDNELKQVSYGLKINKSLRILDLSQNQIQNVGQIKDGLSCNIALEKLDISNNVIDDDGLIKLSEAFISNGCLDTLSISFNDYQMAGIKNFFQIFEQNDSLQNISFSIPQVLTDAELNQLSNIIIQTLITMKGTFKRLEILGNAKKLKESEFFYKFIKEGAFNIEELIIDSILKRNQLQEIINALRLILEGPQNKDELDKFNNHKLKRITFIKPQEFSEEIQMLENLLEEKQNLFFLPQQLKQRFNRLQQQQQMQQLQIQEQINNANMQKQLINNSGSKQQINAERPLQSQQPLAQSPGNESGDDDEDQLDSQLDSSRHDKDDIEAGIQMNMPLGIDNNMGKQVFQQKSRINNSHNNDNRI